MVDRVASSISYSAAATSVVVGGLGLDEFTALCGLFIALVGLIVNIWYKCRMLKIAARKGVNITEDK